MAGPDSIGWRAELEALAATEGVGDRIVWAGMLAGDVKWAAFRAADAFVLTSHTENFGIVVVEALACGTPVLISERVNIWREIVDAGAGLAAPDTLEGSEDLLRRWLGSSPGAVARMRLATVGVFATLYELDGVARRILDALGRAAALGGQRTAAIAAPRSDAPPTTDRTDSVAPRCRCCDGGKSQDLGALPPGSAFAGSPVAPALPGGRLYRCHDCNFVFRHPILELDRYNALYAAAPLGVWSDTGEERTDQVLVLDYIRAAFPHPARILDVGCYDGDLLAKLPPRMERYGVERSAVAAARAHARGVTIIGHDLYDIADESTRFDVIVAMDVVEHTVNPREFILRLMERLTPTGRLLLTSGDADNPVWNRARANYWYCANPEHISFIGHRWLKHLQRSGVAQIVHAQNFRYTRIPPRHSTAKRALVRLLGLLPGAIRTSWTLHLCADHLFVVLQRKAPPGTQGSAT